MSWFVDIGNDERNGLKEKSQAHLFSFGRNLGESERNIPYAGIMAWSATDESRRMLMARIGLFYLFIIIVSCLSILPSSSAKTQVKKNTILSFSFPFFLQSLDYAQQSTLVTRSDNGVNSWAGGFQDGFSSPTALATANKSKDKTRFLKKRKEKKKKRLFRQATRQDEWYDRFRFAGPAESRTRCVVLIHEAHR